MKKILLILFVAVSLKSFGQDCSSIPASFKSYQEASRIIGSAKFKFRDNANTSKSSWIRGAAFYSCDNKYGFLIIKTDDESYIHQNVPVSVWYRFKSASSFGSFYSSNIRGRYQLPISR